MIDAKTRSAVDSRVGWACGGLLPPPALIRARLAEVVREARVLRSLLRVSVAAERDREFLDRIDDV